MISSLLVFLGDFLEFSSWEPLHGYIWHLYRTGLWANTITTRLSWNYGCSSRTPLHPHQRHQPPDYAHFAMYVIRWRTFGHVRGQPTRDRSSWRYTVNVGGENGVDFSGAITVKVHWLECRQWQQEVAMLYWPGPHVRIVKAFNVPYSHFLRKGQEFGLHTLYLVNRKGKGALLL